jgi:hypothetical protein
LSNGSLEPDPFVEHARVRLREFYLAQRFRDRYRGDLAGLLIQTAVVGLMLTLPVFFVFLMTPIGRRMDVTGDLAGVATAVWLLMVATLLLQAVWADRRERAELSRRAATDSDFDIANDYLQKFGAYLSTTSDHEWQVVLRMRELAGWDPSRWGGPEETDRS